ncbi:hypothetical protein, partial [Bradyrhizobium sp.]|uniref:hypothetical protein n=1 Tax=Bradyrhizobium sp. TaxID=376 RepID=UPI0025B89942
DYRIGSIEARQQYDYASKTPVAEAPSTGKNVVNRCRIARSPSFAQRFHRRFPLSPQFCPALATSLAAIA